VNPIISIYGIYICGCSAKVPGVSTFRLQALGEEHEQIKRDIEERLKQEHDMG